MLLPVCILFKKSNSNFLLYFYVLRALYIVFVSVILAIFLQLGDTALHEAARCGFSNTIKLLLQSNANVYCRNKVSIWYSNL